MFYQNLMTTWLSKMERSFITKLRSFDIFMKYIIGPTSTTKFIKKEKESENGRASQEGKKKGITLKIQN